MTNGEGRSIYPPQEFEKVSTKEAQEDLDFELDQKLSPIFEEALVGYGEVLSPRQIAKSFSKAVKEYRNGEKAYKG